MVYILPDIFDFILFNKILNWGIENNLVLYVYLQLTTFLNHHSSFPVNLLMFYRFQTTSPINNINIFTPSQTLYFL